jgi:uroporphyrinogen-III synthase
MSFSPPPDWAPVDDALDRHSTYGALAFTSPRAAAALVERMETRGSSWGDAPNPVVWAVGPATASALKGVLGSVRMPLGRQTGKLGASKALARAMLEAEVSGPVLFPCGEIKRDELPTELRNNGIQVDEVVCYRSVLADESAARTAASRGTVLVVASPSVVDLLARACPRPNRPKLVAVGPTTAASARAAGWLPAAIAVEPTARALTSAIASLLDRR